MSYNANVYRKQGGNQLIVASTGNITVESGGGVEFDSGAQLRIEDGATLAFPTVTETTAAALSNHGVSVVTKGTTATGANTYTIDAPAAGVMKWLSVTAANTSEHVIIQASTAVTFDPAGTKNKLKIVAPGGVGLIGLSTSEYQLQVASTIVAFATS